MHRTIKKALRDRSFIYKHGISYFSGKKGQLASAYLRQFLAPVLYRLFKYLLEFRGPQILRFKAQWNIIFKTKF